MPNRNPASFIDDVPEYEARDGRMHIRMGDAELVMPVHVFLAGCARGRAAIAKWQRRNGGGSVVPIKAG